MRPRLLLISALTLAMSATAGCGPRRVTWQPRTSARADTPSYAVVWGGTPLRMRPDDRSPLVQVARVGRGPGDHVSFRVTRAQRGWVELETRGDDDGAHCAPDLPGFSGVRLRVYVRERELARVSTREQVQRFEDGTAMHLRRGVPMLTGGQRHRARASLGSFSVSVPVTGGEAGTRYLASDDADATRAVGFLDAEGITAALLDGGAPFAASAEARVTVSAVEQGEGEQTLLELDSRCGSFVVRAPEELVRPILDTLSGRSDQLPRVSRGAPAYFANGLEAGAASVGGPIRRPELERADGRRCFSFGGRSDAPGVPLCFDDADLDDREDAGIASELSRP